MVRTPPHQQEVMWISGHSRCRVGEAAHLTVWTQ